MSETKHSLTHRLYTGELAFDFVRRWKTWFLVSGLLLAISLGALGIRQLNLGIEFRGGADFSAPAAVTDQTITDYREAVTATGLPDLDGTTVLTVGDNTVRVQTRSLSPEEVVTVRGAIAKQAGTANDAVAYSLIGASWGDQITKKAVQALVVFIVLVMLLIWAYFRDPKMSIAAIVALLHDLVLTVGIYALVGFTVTPATLIGVLTILGYSLYDTVVVFDKVRENVRDLGNSTYTDAANLAVNQVLVRSLNTTIIGVLPVAALLIAGLFWLHGGPLVDLGLALFVGMVAGAYSSIFIATPLLALLKEREPAMAAHRERLERRKARTGSRARVSVAAVPAGAAPDAGAVSASSAAAPAAARAASTHAAARRQPQRNHRADRKK